METRRFSIANVTKFYLPLMLQGFSQSLTYPLVAGIVSHGPLGEKTLTAFSQGLMIMFTIGAIGGGLVTTGMIFAKTRFGYRSFKQLNLLMMISLLTLQCVPALPPFGGWIFEGFFALPTELATIARRMLVLGVVMNAGFFLRNVPMVVLFNNYESAKANNATLLRIVVTLVLSAAFLSRNWVGADWGLLALTLGVWTEYTLTWLYARPYVRKLEATGPRPAGRRVYRPSLFKLTFEQFRFTMPLALGSFLLAMSPLAIAAFVGRSADAQTMLSIHYVTLGVVNPVAFGALRMQSVAVKFPPEYRGDRRLLWYALAAGALLGLIPLAFSCEWLSGLYFGRYQNIPASMLPTVRLAIALYSGLAIIQAVRGWIEGIAAARKHPRAVMAGQITYTLTLVATCALLLSSGVPGWAMALVAIHFAPIATAAAIHFVSRRS